MDRVLGLQALTEFAESDPVGGGCSSDSNNCSGSSSGTGTSTCSNNCDSADELDW